MLHIFQKISILLFSILLSTNLFSQENHEQKLISLLTDGRFFEAKEFYKQVEKENIFDPFFRLYYKYEMARMLCQSDSSAVYLEQLLEDGDKYFGLFKYQFYDVLLEIYTFELQDYPKAISTCKKIQESLDNNYLGEKSESIGNDLEYVENRERKICEIGKYPPIKITRNDLNNTINIKSEGDLLLFDAIYNKQTFKTLFDTGVSFYFVMKEKVANDIGVRRINSLESKSSIVLNGVSGNVERGIIDSIQIANLKLYNIPVGVYKFDPASNIPDSLLENNPERKKSLECFSQSMDIIMGYPTMSLMRKIIVDFENKTLFFPNNLSIQRNDSIAPNMFVYMSGLYTRLSINDIQFTANVDFGSTSYLHLHSSFYERNRDKIPVKALLETPPLNITMLHKTWLNVPYVIPQNPSLKFNSKHVPVKRDNLIEIYSLPQQQVPSAFDGHIGYPFLKDLGGKILLDFEGMRIDVIE